MASTCAGGRERERGSSSVALSFRNKASAGHEGRRAVDIGDDDSIYGSDYTHGHEWFDDFGDDDHDEGDGMHDHGSPKDEHHENGRKSICVDETPMA